MEQFIINSTSRPQLRDSSDLKLKNFGARAKIWYNYPVIAVGVTGYDVKLDGSGNVYIPEDALEAMIPGFVGVPIYIGHIDCKPEDSNQKPVGFCIKAWKEGAGGASEDLVFDDEANRLLEEEGYEFSSAYSPTRGSYEFAKKGDNYNGIEYSIKLLADKILEDKLRICEHIAIVPKGRHTDQRVLRLNKSNQNMSNDNENAEAKGFVKAISLLLNEGKGNLFNLFKNENKQNEVLQKEEIQLFIQNSVKKAISDILKKERIQACKDENAKKAEEFQEMAFLNAERAKANADEKDEEAKKNADEAKKNAEEAKKNAEEAKKKAEDENEENNEKEMKDAKKNAEEAKKNADENEKKAKQDSLKSNKDGDSDEDDKEKEDDTEEEKALKNENRRLAETLKLNRISLKVEKAERLGFKEDKERFEAQKKVAEEIFLKNSRDAKLSSSYNTVESAYAQSKTHNF